jgi:hypothetical protein
LLNSVTNEYVPVVVVDRLALACKLGHGFKVQGTPLEPGLTFARDSGSQVEISGGFNILRAHWFSIDCRAWRKCSLIFRLGF